MKRNQTCVKLNTSNIIPKLAPALNALVGVTVT